MTELIALARSPRLGARAVLERGRLAAAVALVALATAAASLNAARFASVVSVQEVVFGDRRIALIDALLGTLGRDLTSVVVYLIERSWSALIVASALTPVFIWLLGASSVHAAARLGGAARRPFRPMLVLFGYATALARVPADLAGAALGGDRGAGAQLAGLIGLAGLLWLGLVAWRAIEAHYGVVAGRAFTLLAVAIVLFYLVPLALIVAAAVAILIAAVVLEYFPAR